MSWRNGNKRCAERHRVPMSGLSAPLRLRERPLWPLCYAPLAGDRVPQPHAARALWPAPCANSPGPTRVVHWRATASDVRAFPYRCAKLAAFRQVTQRSNPRDGLSCRYHASSDRCNAGRHRIRPTDRPTCLLRRPVSPGSMTFALAVPTGTRREPTKVPCGAGKQQSNRTDGMWCPVLASTTGAAAALQASSNTYLTGVTTAAKNGALAPRTTLR